MFVLMIATRVPEIYSVSKKTGPLQLISHNFTNSQHSLIIFGVKIPYSILHWLRYNVFFKVG